ncbi:MAG: hypothetical protein ACRDAW_00235 [Metamycoplasmataceae bacterium]
MNNFRNMVDNRVKATKEDKEIIINKLNNIKYEGYYKKNIDSTISALDQKNTFDVIFAVSNILIKIINKNEHFSKNVFLNPSDKSKDIKHILKNISARFEHAKAPIKEGTQKEYDKYFTQTFELLSYVGALEKVKNNNIPNDRSHFVYKIVDYDFIKLLAKDEYNCIYLILLHTYKLYSCPAFIGVKRSFENYIEYNNKMNKESIKDSFKNYMINNTKHREDIGQIYCKFINPLFFIFNLDKFNEKTTGYPKQSYSDLQYNRKHIRDKTKMDFLTRKEDKINKYSCKEQLLSEVKQKKKIVEWNREYFFNNLIKNINSYISEYSEKKIDFCEVHHIIPKHEKTMKDKIDINICENLILLSPNEHTKAHGGNTNSLDKKIFIELLYKQLIKIVEYSEKKIGEYNLYTFYEMCVKYADLKQNNKINDVEIIIAWCENVISYIDKFLNFN